MKYAKIAIADKWVQQHAASSGRKGTVAGSNLVERDELQQCLRYASISVDANAQMNTLQQQSFVLNIG